MKHFNRLFTAILALTVSFVLLFSAACAPGGMALLAETPEPTPTATATPTPTATPSPTPTVEPTPTPTPQKKEAAPGILKGKDKERAEVNQRFEDFLNGVGEYSDENIKNKAFKSIYSDTADLGCIDANNETAWVQGIILFYEKTNQGEVFAFGTKNKKGERIITLIELPSQSIMENDATITFLLYSDRSRYSTPNVKDFLRSSTYYNFLNSHIGDFLLAEIKICTSLDSANYSQWSDSSKKIYAESVDPKISANYSLMANINFVDNNNHLFVNSNDLIKSFYDTKADVLTVDNYDDFKALLETDYNQIPTFLMFDFMSS